MPFVKLCDVKMSHIFVMLRRLGIENQIYKMNYTRELMPHFSDLRNRLDVLLLLTY